MCRLKGEAMSDKMRPHKGMLKRVKVSAKGAVKRKQAGKGHLMSSKSGKRARQLRRTATVPKSELKRIRRLLGIG